MVTPAWLVASLLSIVSCRDRQNVIVVLGLRLKLSEVQDLYLSLVEHGNGRNLMLPMSVGIPEVTSFYDSSNGVSTCLGRKFERQNHF